MFYEYYNDYKNVFRKPAAGESGSTQRDFLRGPSVEVFVVEKGAKDDGRGRPVLQGYQHALPKTESALSKVLRATQRHLSGN